MKKESLVNYFLAFHHRGVTIGAAKKLLENTGKYSTSEIDSAARVAAVELLKNQPKKTRVKAVEEDIESILTSRKKATVVKGKKSNLQALFWLSAIAVIIVVIALVFLLSIKAI